MELFLRETPSEILARIRGAMVLKKHPVGLFTRYSSGGFIGKIDGSAFWIQKTRLAYYSRSTFQRYFRGTVEEVDGGTMLRGKWKFPMRSKVFMVGWTSVITLPNLFMSGLFDFAIWMVLFGGGSIIVASISGICGYRQEEQEVITFLEGLGSSGAETHE